MIENVSAIYAVTTPALYVTLAPVRFLKSALQNFPKDKEVNATYPHCTFARIVAGLNSPVDCCSVCMHSNNIGGKLCIRYRYNIGLI